ncbi:unnamed protein product [Fraxinus pennsylvanica]|uniref:PX domain-containing protein n=1 Tax=Fraxinus pennsylvanica TaxID=56036 RepID=A0AAD2ECL6_9LAMI|nr:unnamed protein product [Fraxinus pennsylvanica]
MKESNPESTCLWNLLLWWRRRQDPDSRLDYSILDMGFADPSLLLEYHDNSAGSSISAIEKNKIDRGIRNDSPPKHRYDGTSPLPLGMDWRPSPLNWDERNTLWPHDFRTGWSYCVMVPSWTILSSPHGSDPVAFYRVEVGLQSPEGVTTSRGILRRFSDFLKLFSDLKRAYPMKKLPPVPPKGLLRMKRKELQEEVNMFPFPFSVVMLLMILCDVFLHLQIFPSKSYYIYVSIQRSAITLIFF